MACSKSLLPLSITFLILSLLFSYLGPVQATVTSAVGGHLPQTISGIGSGDQLDKPRAAFVVHVENDQLHEMLDSMRQMEDTFNNQFNYPWVFFSKSDLSETFKHLTSNATNSTCLYETISDNRTRHKARTDNKGAFNGLSTGKDRRVSRWATGLFAREKRLRRFDWFWSIHPGSQFTCDIPFDVFRIMRDHGLSYGYNQESFSNLACQEQVLRRTRSFIYTHPELLHADADLSWISQIDNIDRTVLREPVAAKEDSWIGKIWDNCKLYPDFEIGALNFLRSPQHLAFFNHLENAAALFEPVNEVPLHSISASMFLPRQSVWSTGRSSSSSSSSACRSSSSSKVADYQRWESAEKHGEACPPGPNPTPNPESKTEQAMTIDAGWSFSFGPDEEHLRRLRGQPSEKLAARHVMWDLLATDLHRQQAIPSLISGNTVVDKRNFEPSWQ